MQKLIFRLALLTSIVAIMLVVAVRLGNSNQGNPARGAEVFEGNLAVCFACHVSGTLDHFAHRALDVRLQAPENADKTLEQFVAESILYHNAYIAGSTQNDSMPTLYTRLLSRRDVLDLVAYLLCL